MTKITKASSLSSLKNIKHGFFHRTGGVSEGIYASLNIGYGSNDDQEKVIQNRKIAIKALDSNLKEENLNTLYQIHSDKVHIVTDNFEGKIEADAMVTDAKNVAIGILTADCTPVLFADAENGIIGGAHAGWKGAFGGILENTVDEMKKLGAKNIVAAIGPTIRQASYEVDSTFRDRFINDNSLNSQFFIPSSKEGHYMFDLPSYVKSRLAKLGLVAIDDVGIDTYPEENDLFSYRRTCHKGEADYGRNLSVIVRV